MNRGIIVIVIAAVAAVALAAAFIVVQIQVRQSDDPDITSIVFHQSQAIQDFDDSEYIQTAAGALAEFGTLLEEYGVDPGVTDTSGDACPGSLTSTLRIEYVGGETADLDLTTCGAPIAYDDFNQRATDLVSEWREQLAPTPVVE